MEIKEITRYKFDGMEFDSLPKVKTEVENRIGKIIDKVPLLSFKQRLDLLHVLSNNKSELSKLLSVTFQTDTSELHNTIINILDL